MVASYNEWRGHVHANHGTINPAEEPLHYQLDMASDWTLNRQNRYDYMNSSCSKGERGNKELHKEMFSTPPPP